MFFQRPLPLADLAIAPIKFVTPDNGVREGDNNSEEEDSDEEEGKMTTMEPGLQLSKLL